MNTFRSRMNFHCLGRTLLLLGFAGAFGCAADPDPDAGAPPRDTRDGLASAGSGPAAAGNGSPSLTPLPAAAPGTPGSGGTPGAAGGSSGGAAGSFGVPSAAGSVRELGALRVAGNRIVDAAGRPVQLRGMSLFWTQWSNYYLASTVDQLAEDWGAGVVRAALGVDNGGYLANPTQNEAKVVTIVDRAIARDIYVIIDWHDHNAEDHQAQAIDFFTRMATKYRDYPHVIYEIYNEPLDIGWPAVKAYAEAVIAAIRGAGANNLVIVGTPSWSQDVDVAATSPIASDPNVAYTLHFYAATHKQWLRDKAKVALDAGLALFVTEWGTCDASGDGSVNAAETKVWLDFMAEHRISWLNWALNDKAEACSALTPSAGTMGPWTGNALTTSGALVKPLIR